MSIWFIVARNDAGDREVGILHRGEYIFQGGKKRIRRNLIPTAFAQSGGQSWPVANQSLPEADAWPDPRAAETGDTGEHSSSATFTDSSTTSTVSWPSYSGGVELPPATDPAAIQAAGAEPFGEPDPTADPHNQEHA